MTEHFNKINYLGKVSDLCSSSFCVMVSMSPLPSFGIEDYIRPECLLHNIMNYANKWCKCCFEDYSIVDFIFIAKIHLFCDFLIFEIERSEN